MTNDMDVLQYDVAEIGELLTDIDRLDDLGVDCLAAVEAATQRLTPAERELVGRLLEDLVAVTERRADMTERA